MGSRRDEQEDQKTVPAALPSSSERQQQEIREAIVSAFDEATGCEKQKKKYRIALKLCTVIKRKR